jgi:hypothetical protein
MDGQLACPLGYNEFDFFRKLRIQTLQWVLYLNLGHINFIGF